MVKHIKFIVRDLRGALGIAAGFCETRSIIPSLSCVLITARATGAEVLATNLDHTIKVPVPASGQKGAEFLVSRRQLFALLSTLPGDAEVSICEGKEGAVFLEWPGARYVLAGLNPNDFSPVYADAQLFDPVLELNPAQFRAALKIVAGAVSTEETRYYLNGVCVHTLGGALSITATDGHRLSTYALEPKSSLPKEIAAIIPRYTVLALLAARGVMPTRIRFASQKAAVVIDCEGGIEIHAKLFDANFPDVARVIPKAADPICISVAIKPLRAALRRVLAIEGGRRNGGHASLFFAAGGVWVAPQSGEAKGSAERAGIVDCMGDFEIGFNARYLLCLLADHESLGAQSIRFQFTDAASPALVEAGALRSVVMPLRTTSDLREIVSSFKPYETPQVSA